MTDRHTDRISSCRLDPFCRSGRVKIYRPVTHEPKFVGLFQTHFDFSCVSESEIRRWFKLYKRVWMESGNEKARFPDNIRLRRYLLGEV